MRPIVDSQAIARTLSAKEDGERAFLSEILIYRNLIERGHPVLVISFGSRGKMLAPSLLDPFNALSEDAKAEFSQKAPITGQSEPLASLILAKEWMSQGRLEGIIKNANFGDSYSDVQAAAMLARHAFGIGADVIFLDSDPSGAPPSLAKMKTAIEKDHKNMLSRCFDVCKENSFSTPSSDRKSPDPQPWLIFLNPALLSIDAESPNYPRDPNYVNLVNSEKLHLLSNWWSDEEIFQLGNMRLVNGVDRASRLLCKSLSETNRDVVRHAVAGIFGAEKVREAMEIGISEENMAIPIVPSVSSTPFELFKLQLSCAYPHMSDKQLSHLITSSFQSGRFHPSTICTLLDKVFPAMTVENVKKAIDTGENHNTLGYLFEQLIDSRERIETEKAEESIASSVERLFSSGILSEHICISPAPDTKDEILDKILHSTVEVREDSNLESLVDDELTKTIVVPRHYDLLKILSPILFPEKLKKGETPPVNFTYNVDALKQDVCDLLLIPKEISKQSNDEKRILDGLDEVFSKTFNEVPMALGEFLKGKMPTHERIEEYIFPDISHSGKTVQLRCATLNHLLCNSILRYPEFSNRLESRLALRAISHRGNIQDEYFRTSEFQELLSIPELRAKAVAKELTQNHSFVDVTLSKDKLTSRIREYFYDERLKPEEVARRRRFIRRQIEKSVFDRDFVTLLWPPIKEEPEPLRNMKADYHTMLDALGGQLGAWNGEYVIWHHQDVDGIVAAGIAAKAIEQLRPGCKISFRNAMFANQVILDSPNAFNLILDIAIPDPELTRIKEAISKGIGTVFVVDHHYEKFVSEFNEKEHVHRLLAPFVLNPLEDGDMLEPCTAHIMYDFFTRIMENGDVRPKSMRVFMDLAELGDSLFTYRDLVFLASKHPSWGANLDDRVHRIFLLSRVLTQIASIQDDKTRTEQMAKFMDLDAEPIALFHFKEQFAEPIQYDLAAREILSLANGASTCVVLRENRGTQAAGILVSTMETLSMGREDTASFVFQPKGDYFELKVRGNPSSVPALKWLLDNNYLFHGRGRAYVSTTDTKQIGNVQLSEILNMFRSHGIYIDDELTGGRIRNYLVKI